MIFQVPECPLFKMLEMERVEFSLPAKKLFSTRIPLRITDMNYSGHMGNDALLSIVHEARMQFFRHYGFSEMNLGGPGIIMADAAIKYVSEAFAHEVLQVEISADGGTTWYAATNGSSLGQTFTGANNSLVYRVLFSGDNASKTIAVLDMNISWSSEYIVPQITWESPTPDNDSTTENEFAYLNTTIADNGTTSAWFDWNNSLVVATESGER